jgi:hypothetical protein
VALGDQQVDRLAGALDVVDTDIGNAALVDGLEDADARRQAGRHGLVAEGQDAGEQDQPGRLVGIEEFQIFQPALRVVVGMADEDAVAVRPRLVFQAHQDVGEIRVADIGRHDEDHVRTAEAQAARHRVRRVAGDGDRLVDLQPRRVRHLFRHVDRPGNGRNRDLRDPRNIFDRGGAGRRHCGSHSAMAIPESAKRF